MGLLSRIRNLSPKPWYEFPVSEADRCQQVLLSHQRQKRKGLEWVSPESKTTSRQSSILDYVVCNLYVVCAWMAIQTQLSIRVGPAQEIH